MSGNTAYVSVQMANRMARRIAYLWLVKIKVSNILHPLLLCMKKGTGPFCSRLFKPESKDSIFKEAECPMDHREPQYKLAVEIQIYSRYLSANWETCFANHSSSMSHNSVFSRDLCLYVGATKNLISKCGAVKVGVPLGAYGAYTAKPAPCQY